IMSESRIDVIHVTPDSLQRGMHLRDAVRPPADEHLLAILRRPQVDLRLPHMHVAIRANDLEPRRKLIDSSVHLSARDTTVPVPRLPQRGVLSVTVRRRELVLIQ